MPPSGVSTELSDSQGNAGSQVSHEAHATPLSSSAQVGDLAPAFAVLPVGAHEQHGAHLPLATDSIVAAWAGRELCARLRGLLLPAVPYGTSVENRGFPGTISLRWQTLAAIVEDVVLECYRQGILTVFVISGHGGNFILNPCLRSLNSDHVEGHAVLVPESAVFGDVLTRPDDLHSGRWETSVMLALHPEAVRMEAAVDFVPSDPRRSELTNRPFSHFTPSGVWGRPSEASAAEGRRLLAEVADRVCAYASGWLGPSPA